MICNHFQLQDVCNFIDYRGKTPPKTTSGIPLITAKIIKNGVIQSPQEFIAEDYYDEWMRRGIPSKGAVIITTEAPLGEVAVITTDAKIAFAQRIIVLEPNYSLIDNYYLYYALQDSVLRNRIQARQTGTTVSGIKAGELKKVIIDLPSIEIQKQISSVLRALDSKIELNNRLNENLEQQAFATFDKLMNAKAERVGPLSAIADLNPKRDLARNAPARCIDMACLSTIGSFPNGWEVKPYTGGMKFRNGDTLLARITPCLENGKTAFINFLDDGEVAFGSTEYIVICPKDDYPPEFFYCLARYPAFVDYAVKNLNGSSGRQRVSAETIGKYEIPQPNNDALEYFISIVPALFKAIRNNSFENERLANMRDALLPKLMSGELDVSEIII